jgi:hypothetical protein
MGPGCLIRAIRVIRGQLLLDVIHSLLELLMSAIWQNNGGCVNTFVEQSGTGSQGYWLFKGGGQVFLVGSPVWFSYCHACVRDVHPQDTHRPWVRDLTDPKDLTGVSPQNRGKRC